MRLKDAFICLAALVLVVLIFPPVYAQLISGACNNFTAAVPGPIGSTTPSTGVFTTLQANTSLTLPSDNAVTSMARIPMFFDEGTETALTANESLGTYKTVKAITIENIELDVKKSPTCSVSEQITCYDCGTAAGACTAGQTATIMNAITIASGATRQSVDETVNTANVAAGHYISCLITAGTCTVSDNAISMMARPQ